MLLEVRIRQEPDVEEQVDALRGAVPESKGHDVDDGRARLAGDEADDGGLQLVDVESRRVDLVVGEPGDIDEQAPLDLDPLLDSSAGSQRVDAPGLAVAIDEGLVA